MKIRSRCFLLLFSTFLFCACHAVFAGVPADSLTVDQAISMALAHNPAIGQAAAAVQGAQARTALSETGYYPNLSVDGAYTRIGPVPELTVPGSPVVFRLYPQDNWDAHVAVRQTVFDFGRTRSTVAVAESQAATAEQGVEIARAAVAFQTAQVYSTILVLQRSIEVEERQVSALQEHLRVAEQRARAGAATEYDVLTTRVRVGTTQNVLSDLNNSMQKQIIVLRRLMGVPDSTVLLFGGSLGTGQMPLNADSLAARALEYRPEYLAAKRGEESAALEYQAARVSGLPSLSAQAQYGVKNGYIPNLDVLRGNWVLGVAVRIPIYEGGRTGAAEEVARAGMQAAAARRLDLEQQVVAEVRQGVTDLRTTREKTATAELQVEQAQEALSLARTRYNAGTVSTLEVLDATTALEQAELQRLNRLYAAVVNELNLRRAVGDHIW